MGSVSINILYILKCDVIVKILKYLEIYIKIWMLFIYFKLSLKYKDLRFYLLIVCYLFFLVYYIFIDNMGSMVSGDIVWR